MKAITLAGLFGAALLAVLVNSPVEGSPLPEANPEPEPVAEAEPGRSLGPAYESDYAQGCDDSEGGGGGGSGGGGGGGGGNLLEVDLEVLLAIDLSGLGDLLNALLGLLLGVSQASPCDYDEYASQFEGIIADIYVYVNLLGIEIQVNLLIILGPLLEAVLGLVEGLLAGVLIDLTLILNLVLNLLATLNLEIDLDVAVQLGNLLNLDVLALVALG